MPEQAPAEKPPAAPARRRCEPTQWHLRQRKARMEAAAASVRQTAAHIASVAAEPAAPEIGDAAAAQHAGEQPADGFAVAPEEDGAQADAPALDHLAPEQQAQLEGLLSEFEGQLSNSSDDMGAVPEEYEAFFLRIPTDEGAQCKQRPYKLSYKELTEFERQLANLLARGVIKKADGPTDFLSPVLFVPKPWDPTALRMCVDFRRLNAVAKRDFHALPAVQEVLQQMRGCKYFTALDLSSGLWALPIAERDQHKTAFTGPDGEVYVWRKAAMGLSNSPAAFQRFMKHVLQGIPGVSVYIDDITIYSKTWQEHLATLRRVLERLRGASLKVKASKCVWAAAECRVLGSIVNEDGIAPDPEKTSAVQRLPVPRNVADLRSFLGATGYFQQHIAGYAELAAPLRTLLKKDAKWAWSAECQQAFEGLKAALTSDAVLRMPDVTRPFILTTDWSKLAVGAVLSQMQPERPDDPGSPEKEYVISCASRGTTPAEANYALTEGECLALVWATRKFRQYLHGTKFTVRTDHAALKWLATARFENSKLERWAMRLQEFAFEVEYVPGPDNVVADHLSRNIEFPHLLEGAITAVAGHFAFAAATRALDVIEDGGDVLDPEAWASPRLQQLWQSADAEAITCEPCTECGQAEGYQQMVLCDTCDRPYHLQCCQPPRSVVPPGDWHCPMCTDAYRPDYLAEMRSNDTVLFPRASDPFHPAQAEQVAVFVRGFHEG